MSVIFTDSNGKGNKLEFKRAGWMWEGRIVHANFTKSAYKISFVEWEVQKLIVANSTKTHSTK